MVSFIDNFLNKITMYRLTRYCLAFLLTVGFLLSFFNFLPFKPIDLVFSFIIISYSCLVFNNLFENILKTLSNKESTYITALILSLVIGPGQPKEFFWLIIISAIAIASKYLITINKKHIFNPAAFAMVVVSFSFDYWPSWWIGDYHMIFPVLIIGFLIVRKLQRFDLVLSFLIFYLAISFQNQIFNFSYLIEFVKQMVIYSPILFFAFIMVTEPATTPPKKILRIAYGAIIAFLMAPFINIKNIYFTPELALLVGNVFSYLVSPKEKLKLVLREKRLISKNVYEFIFNSNKKLKFEPGQYMEWTLVHHKPDNRGVRRYFTIASSPTESEIKLGVKFYNFTSSFKKSLVNLQPNDTIIASQLAGEFVMPKNKNKKMIFIAGGIGITPFRSMIKYLLDKKEKRDIIIFYANKNFAEIAYKNLFDQANKELGIKVVYVLEGADGAPNDFNFKLGFVTKNMIEKEALDYAERIFYISGPKSMITAFKKILSEMNISKRKIKTDFFPGFA